MDNPHLEVEIKPQLNPRGSVAKEEDSKPSYQLTSCRLNLRDLLSRLCVYRIYKRPSRAPTKTKQNKTNKQTKTLDLKTVDVGGKNT